jgi:hypothetical protein
MSATLTFCVQGCGLLGPGLANWAGGQGLLREPGAWLRSATAAAAPQSLPATERRRAGTVVKASIAVAEEACAAAAIDAAALATVFASSTGDPVNCHLICEALAAAERHVSPTRFTNSVHNAAAGYWHIAMRSMAASTSLAAYDFSFGAGLIEAAAQCASGAAPVLLVCCDVPYPEPLHGVRPIADAFAVAMVLAPPRDGAPRIELRTDAAQAATPCEDAGLDAVRQAIPAARALPLLQAMARGRPAHVILEGLPGQSLEVALQP